MHRPPFVGFDYANNIQLFASLIDVFEENSTSLAARMTHRGLLPCGICSYKRRSKQKRHLIRHGVAVPPSPTGEGLWLLSFRCEIVCDFGTDDTIKNLSNRKSKKAFPCQGRGTASAVDE